MYVLRSSSSDMSGAGILSRVQNTVISGAKLALFLNFPPAPSCPQAPFVSIFAHYIVCPQAIEPGSR